MLPTSLHFEVDKSSGGPGGDQAALGWPGSPGGQSLKNPATVYCQDLGYAFGVVEGTDGGQRGQCTFPDNTACDAWEFLAGTCGQERSICALKGYGIALRDDGRDPFSREYAVCVDAQGKVQGSVTEMTDLWAKVAGLDAEDDGSGDLFFKPPALAVESESLAPAPERGDAQPPASFDWRNHDAGNWMTSVKDQASCGGCWGFSAVGTAEAAFNIAAGNPNLDLNLSEQYMIADCSTAGACDGGWHDTALYYIRDNGIPDEACLPFGDSACTYDGLGNCEASTCTYATGGECSNFRCSDRCSDWASRLHQLDRATCMSSSSTKEAIKEALVDHGPLAVRMNMDGSFSGDIYQCSSSSTNHAVIIAGYSDSGGYWIVKNSWGTSWNGDGYFKVAYDNCGIQVQPCYADASPASGLTICNEGPGDLQVTDIHAIGTSCWLSVTPDQVVPFTLGTGQCESVAVDVDASCVSTGQYNDTIRIRSNDPDEDPFDVPVSLDVTGPDECYSLDVDVSPSSGGFVGASPSENCSGGYTPDTVVTLTADPSGACTFSHWSGDLSGSANPDTITMNGNKSVTAHFDCPCDAVVRAVGGDVAPDGTIVVPVEAVTVPSPGLGAATVQILYDPAVVTPTACDADPANVLDSALCNTGAGPGQVSLTAVSTAGRTGDTVLAEITFTAIGVVSETSPLNVVIETFADPNGLDIPVCDEDGEIHINEADGDVNCDGQTNSIDALFILQKEVGLRSCTDVCPLPAGQWLNCGRCDVSGDGSCNSIDALFILQCEVGIPNVLCPAGGLAARSMVGGTAASPGAVRLMAGSGYVAPRGTVNVPVVVDLSGGALGAGTLEITYDTAVLNATGCAVDPAGVFDSALCNIDPASGKIRVSAVSAAGVNGEAVFAELTFEAVGRIGQRSPLTVATEAFADPGGQAIGAGIQSGRIGIVPRFVLFLRNLRDGFW